jgi:hypothetical protein
LAVKTGIDLQGGKEIIWIPGSTIYAVHGATDSTRMACENALQDSAPVAVDNACFFL